MAFDPTNVDLTTADQEDVLCYYAVKGNDYNGHLGARISSIFVIGAVSTFVTYFPVIAKRRPAWKIPLSVYTFARFFGSGVIVSTAFIHLLDPAYKGIGSNTCIGNSPQWKAYSWCPAIVLAAVMFVFLIDLIADVYVERKYGISNHENEVVNSDFLRSGEPDASTSVVDPEASQRKDTASVNSATSCSTSSSKETLVFAQRIGAFLVLEFGIIFHSFIIGLNLGVVGDEFTTLYPVLVFHQSFEGLGIGARLSTIPFPKGKKWMPWVLCALYGLTTPLAIAVGLGVRTTYEPNSHSSLVVQGVLNAISAGFLIYSGLVELLAKDFLVDPKRTKNLSRLFLNVAYVFLGAGVMALIGFWA